MMKDSRKPVNLFIGLPFHTQGHRLSRYYTCNADTIPPEYMAALRKEMKYVSWEFREQYYAVSVCIGGGQPLMMSPAELTSLADEVRELFFVADDAEFSIETPPDILDANWMFHLQNMGMNRLVLNFVTGRQEDFKRYHIAGSLEKSRNAIALSQMFRIPHYAGILLYGLPNQKAENFLMSTRFCCQYQVPEIIMRPIDPDKEDMITRPGREYLLERGYNQYLPGHFCLPGFESVSERANYVGDDYLAFGAGMVSCQDRVIYQSVPSMCEYIKNIDNARKLYTVLGRLEG